MTKILCIGDTHGDTSSLANVAIPKARKHDCPVIVQLGDFGYHEHVDRGRVFLDKVSKCLVRENITMFWIDGNHSNHPLLWEKYPQISAEMGERYAGLCEVRPNLYYVPRGTVWKIGEVTCLGLGGAFSIDRDYRLQREREEGRELYYWWPTEMITDSDVSRAIRNAQRLGPIDLFFTHDCPTGTDIPGVHSEGKWIYPETWLNRDRLREVFDAVQPKMLLHGHYHYRYTSKLPLKPSVGEGDLLEWDYCRVDGLACNGMHGFAVVLDLESLFINE